MKRRIHKAETLNEVSAELPEYLWPPIMADWAKQGAFFAGKLLNYKNFGTPDMKDVQILWKGLGPRELEAIGNAALELARGLEKSRNRVSGKKTRIAERYNGRG